MLGVLAIGALGFALSLHFGLIGGPQFTEGLVVSERPMSLNPLVDGTDPAVVDVGHLLYRSLLKLDGTGYPEDDLASSWAVSASGLVYTLTLAPSLEWSNGQPITAADVVASDTFALSFAATDPTVSAGLRGVAVTEAGLTITFKLPAPRASFAASLTELPILPLGGLSAAALAAETSNPTVPMPTSGPYDVRASDARAIDLQPNPHATVHPHIGSYELRLFIRFGDAESAFAQGNLNALLATTPEELAQLLAVKGARAESITTPDFVDLLFNEHVPGLTDSIVRQAIGTAINRSAVVAGALDGAGGVVETGPFSDGVPWIGSPSPEAFSPAVADAVLQADGWIPGAGGVRSKGSALLAFTLKVPNIDPLPVVAREVAAQLDAIGVQVTIQTVVPEDFVTSALDTEAFQLAINTWSPGPDPDVSAFWRSNAAPPRGYYVSAGPVDPFLDSALDILAESPVRQLRVDAAAQVATLLADDAPAIFLYTPRVSMVFRAPTPVAALPSLGEEWARYNDIATWQLR
jgi:peptide/nickel transport system substrate-binding protein